MSRMPRVPSEQGSEATNGGSLESQNESVSQAERSGDVLAPKVAGPIIDPSNNSYKPAIYETQGSRKLGGNGKIMREDR